MSTNIPKMMRFRSRARSILRDTNGNAAIEFAFGTPFLILLLVGAINFGLVIEQNIRIASAARAGAQYATHTMARSYDSDGITTAVRNDANDDDNALSIASARYCMCPETAEAVDCSSSCAGSESPRVYVSVTVDREIALLLPIPGFADSQELSHTVDMRVR